MELKLKDIDQLWKFYPPTCRIGDREETYVTRKTSMPQSALNPLGSLYRLYPTYSPLSASYKCECAALPIPIINHWMLNTATHRTRIMYALRIVGIYVTDIELDLPQQQPWRLSGMS